MPTIADAYAAMNVLKTHLRTRLNADYVSVFAGYGGVDVILEDDEPEDQERVGKPYILLGVQGEDDAPDWGRGVRAFTVRADVVASEFAGAQTGAANLVGSDTLLASTLREIVRTGYATLRDAGLMAVVIKARTEQNNDGIHSNAHEITGVIFPE